MPTLSPETWIFIGVIVVAAIISHVRFTEKTAHDAPGLLITIGIFATFFGIASGLYSFNVDNVESSLPKLITGIKLAFWASVIGVGAAITLKMRYAIWGVRARPDSAPTEGATIDDLVVHLKSSADSLTRLQTSIAGTEDSSLLTQLKLSRSDQNDRLDSLRKAFNEFAEKQAENNSKALIEALKEVIRDFNEKIHEQFGENFRHLNEAVGKINEWQQAYRQQLTELIDHEKQIAADMKVSADAFGNVVERSKEFGKVSEDLKQTIGSMSEIEAGLRANLVELGKLIESAKGGLPTIQQKVTEIIDDIGNGAKLAATVIENQVKLSTSEQEKLIREHAKLIGTSIDDVQGAILNNVTVVCKNLEDSSDRMSTSVKKHTDDMAASIEGTREQLQQQIQALSQELAKAIQRHNETISSNINELSNKTEQQVIALDTALAAALTKSLDSLGQQLGSLSTKFVSDYGPLTEKLKDVVHLASRINA